MSGPDRRGKKKTEMGMSEKAREIRRCKAGRRDGQPCQGFGRLGERARTAGVSRLERSA